MALEGIDHKTAERRQEAEDRARTRYVSDAYGVDRGDASLYHLMIGSTALNLDTCVELMATASRGGARQADTGSTEAKQNVPA